MISNVTATPPVCQPASQPNGNPSNLQFVYEEPTKIMARA